MPDCSRRLPAFAGCQTAGTYALPRKAKRIPRAKIRVRRHRSRLVRDSWSDWPGIRRTTQVGTRGGWPRSPPPAGRSLPIRCWPSARLRRRSTRSGAIRPRRPPGTSWRFHRRGSLPGRVRDRRRVPARVVRRVQRQERARARRPPPGARLAQGRAWAWPALLKAPPRAWGRSEIARPAGPRAQSSDPPRLSFANAASNPPYRLTSVTSPNASSIDSIETAVPPEL